MDTKSILLVEDNPDDEALTLRALDKSGVNGNVVVVRDGAEALDYLFCRGPYAGRDVSQTPVMVLLDLKLPKLGGIEVLKEMRRDDRMRCIPVVVLTSSREQQDIQNSYSSGANSYVRKPVDFVEFTEAVKQLGTYWLRINEPPPRVRSA